MSKFQDTLNQIHFLCEKKRKRSTTTQKKIKSKSLENRKERSVNVVIYNHKTSDPISKGQIKRHTCNAKSKEQSESKKHTCQVDVTKKGKIDMVSCSCSDFQARYQYYRNADGVSQWDTVVPIKNIFKPHTKEEPKVTNPNGIGYICKHLIKFVDKIKDV